MASNATFPRDANRVPNQVNGLVITNSKTLTANNTTAVVPIFTVVGTVEVIGLYGVVTTDLGANHTAASWRINDQSAQVYLTLLAGTTLSAIKAGSMIVKEGLAASALTKIDNAAGAISEPAAAQGLVFSEVIIVKKTAALTQIEYKYTTTDTPTSGAIKFYCCFVPLSDDGDVLAV